MSKKPLKDVVDSMTYNIIIDLINKTRKDHGDGRTFTYEEITREWKGKTIKIMARHYPLEKVFSLANGSCTQCGGKGYFYSHIPKIKFPDPSLFLLDIDYLPKSKDPKDQKEWQEKQSKISTWKVLNVCSAAARKAMRKNPNLHTNPLYNIWIIIDYEILEKEDS